MTTLIEINLDLIGQSINQSINIDMKIISNGLKGKKHFRGRDLSIFFFANNFIRIFHHDGDNNDDDDDE